MLIGGLEKYICLASALGSTTFKPTELDKKKKHGVVWRFLGGRGMTSHCMLFIRYGFKTVQSQRTGSFKEVNRVNLWWWSGSLRGKWKAFQDIIRSNVVQSTTRVPGPGILSVLHVLVFSLALSHLTWANQIITSSSWVKVGVYERGKYPSKPVEIGSTWSIQH